MVIGPAFQAHQVQKDFERRRMRKERSKALLPFSRQGRGSDKGRLGKVFMEQKEYQFPTAQYLRGLHPASRFQRQRKR